MASMRDMLDRITDAVRYDLAADLEMCFVQPVFSENGDVSYITPTYTGHNGITLLHMSVWLGARECTELLLDHGADVNAADRTGKTPLHLAAWRNMGSLSRLLLDRGANSDTLDSFGISPLHMAAMYNSARAVEELIKSGANIDAQDGMGASALHWAASKNAASTVELLLKAGADPTIENLSGATPADVARREKQDKMADCLEKAAKARQKTPAPKSARPPKPPGLA